MIFKWFETNSELRGVREDLTEIDVLRHLEENVVVENERRKPKEVTGGLITDQNTESLHQGVRRAE